MGSGFAVFKSNNEIKGAYYRLPDTATVFQAELTAIDKAATYLTETKPDDLKYVKIYVDSQAAILSLANPMISNKTTLGAVESLNRLSTLAKSVTIVWIPAHKGHLGNERADELAKLGAANNDPLNIAEVHKPVSAFKAEIKRIAYTEWTSEWQQSRMANHTKSFYDRPDSQKAKHVYKLARLELGRFIRVVTGHNNLRFFQTKIGLWNDERCRLCNDEQETITHLLRACPRTTWKSREVFLDKLPNSDMTWSVRDLLDFSYEPSINDAFEGELNSYDPLGNMDLDTIRESEEQDGSLGPE